MTPEQKENVQALIQALRSGKFKQTSSVLADTTKGKTKYCCLGVACEIAIKRGLTVTKESVSGTSERIHIRYDESHEVLPSSVKEYYGFISSSGTFDAVHYSSLAGMNDDGQSFKKIATTIEKALKAEDHMDMFVRTK